MKIGINSSLSIYCKGAAHLLISFNFTISVYCSITFNFRRSFHHLISFYSRRAISCSVTSESGIAGYVKGISFCTTGYIQTAFSDSGLIVQGESSVNCLISLYGRRSINGRITFHCRRTVHRSVTSKSRITGYSKEIGLCTASYIQAAFCNGGLIVQGRYSVNCLISLYSRRTIHSSVTSESRITGYIKRISLCATSYIQSTFSNGSFIVQSSCTINCLISLGFGITSYFLTANSRFTGYRFIAGYYRITIYCLFFSSRRIGSQIRSSSIF